MKLKELRNSEQKSSEELAKLLDISIQAYYKYENGKAEPNIQNLIKLADFYNVTLDYLVGRPFNNEFGYMSSEEKMLVNKFRQLNTYNQAKIIGEVSGMLIAQN